MTPRFNTQPLFLAAISPFQGSRSRFPSPAQAGSAFPQGAEPCCHLPRCHTRCTNTARLWGRDSARVRTIFLLSIALSNEFVPPLCSHQLLQPFPGWFSPFPAFGLLKDGSTAESKLVGHPSLLWGGFRALSKPFPARAASGGIADPQGTARMIPEPSPQGISQLPGGSGTASCRSL